MIALAREKNLILAEAMTIWHMPIYKKLWETVKSGSLGKSPDDHHEFWKF